MALRHVLIADMVAGRPGESSREVRLAGAVAQNLSESRRTLSDGWAILDASAIDMGVAGRDMQYGYGLVNAKRAVDLAGAFRASYIVNRTTLSEGERTVIVRGGAGLPSWIEQASVFDGSGRLVQTGRSGLKPGTYFVRESPKSGGQRTKDEGQRTVPDVTRRLLVLD